MKTLALTSLITSALLLSACDQNAGTETEMTNSTVETGSETTESAVEASSDMANDIMNSNSVEETSQRAMESAKAMANDVMK
jgi:hypothetical protein|tara:strand:+ start:336 stop:581 length:246 start_codon:yes stop_codon:yes gene_type:complete